MSRLLGPVAFLLSVVIGLTLFCSGCTDTQAGEGKIAAPAHPCNFYDEGDFLESIYKPKTESIEREIRGGVVPHHLVAGYMIADFFNLLSDQGVERVILLGPNHYRRGPRVASSRYNWLTAFGVLETDTGLVDTFVDSGIAGIDEEAMPLEHSIAGIVPYIKYYLPEARVVPLIFHPDITQRETDNLADLLLQNTRDGDVIVASVDFSHYLRLEDAEQRDRVTIEAIRRKDYVHLLKMGDQHLDSSPSIITLLKVMDERGAGDMTVLHHSNSALVLEKDAEETTSYFTIVYN